MFGRSCIDQKGNSTGIDEVEIGWMIDAARNMSALPEWQQLLAEIVGDAA